jgi:pyruvate dehydrogenase E1 component beta subunit
MGEEVAEYNGAYKASKGMLAEFGEKRVIDTLLQSLVYWNAVGSAMNGCRPIVEYMTFNFVWWVLIKLLTMQNASNDRWSV